MRVIDYEFVIFDEGTVSDDMQHILADGWQPFGSPFVHGGIVHQAIVKYDLTRKK